MIKRKNHVFLCSNSRTTKDLTYNRHVIKIWKEFNNVKFIENRRDHNALSIEKASSTYTLTVKQNLIKIFTIPLNFNQKYKNNDKKWRSSDF